MKRWVDDKLGICVVQPDVFRDFRGEYVGLFSEKEYGLSIQWKQDTMSWSTRGVLRGFHGDDCTWKLVSCLKGRIFLAVLCNDHTSKAYGKIATFTITDADRTQVLVPPNHGLAHQVLSDEALFWYKQSTEYDPESQWTVGYQVYSDWPIRPPILSARDRKAL